MNLSERINIDNHIGTKAERILEFANIFIRNIYDDQLEISVDDNEGKTFTTWCEDRHHINYVALIIDISSTRATESYMIPIERGDDDAAITQFVSGLRPDFTVEELRARLLEVGQRTQ